MWFCHVVVMEHQPGNYLSMHVKMIMNPKHERLIDLQCDREDNETTCWNVVLSASAMPEHVTGQVTKHLAPLTYLLVGIIIVGSYFDFILYANGDGLSSCSTRCLCMEKQKLVNCTDRAFREIPSDLPLITVRLTLDWNFIEALSAPSFSTLHSLENFSIAHNRV